MKLHEALSILETHQRWRQGAEIQMAEPKVISKALDVILGYFQDELSETEIEKLASDHILYNDSKKQWVIEGMKLYREHLKSRE
jgi:hypothetical protein